MDELKIEIILDLTTELSSEPTFDSSVLLVKVENAIREVKKPENTHRITQVSRLMLICKIIIQISAI